MDDLRAEINKKLREEARRFPLKNFLKSNGSTNITKIRQLHPDFQQEALNLIFIRKALKVQKEEYGYERVNYKTANQLVEIWCYKHKGYFMQTARSHLDGHGCLQCARESNLNTPIEKPEVEEDVQFPTYLYIFSNKDQSRKKLKTKIGVSREPHQRFKNLEYDKLRVPGFEDMEVFGIYQYKKGSKELAYKIEHQAHKFFENKFANHYKFDGAKEIFNIKAVEAEEYLLSQGCIKIYPTPNS
ncbi:endonuclease [Salmonella phage vB_SenS_S124]|uniref:Endonuclease n=1 Tax=Salmonella phage vB_SenS_S124 TaxID=2886210 RepID=A0AAE9C1F9_9CAUD|nr:endonuclease [Salmonella phage vB_SenS_S124]UIS66021.1 hypothetical protein [Escherichia phage PNJ1902]